MFQSSLAIFVLICAVTSHKGGRTTEEHVDLIELNHFYDQQGRLVYDQVIFYARAPETGRFQVRAWCLVEDREYLNRRPVKNYETQIYQVDWYDSDQRLLRKISSRLYRESWSQVDPERANKRFHDERLRISMVQNPAKLQGYESQSQIDEVKQSRSLLNNLTEAQIPTPLPQVVPTTPLTETLVVR